MEIRINPSTSYPLYCDSTGNRKLLQSDLSFACYYLSSKSKSDNKAVLLIRLKKYLNPHENSCSKVISILITGNSLHESSSAPQQYKSVQYKWLALYLHRDVSHTDMLQPHFISCRGVSGGRRQHARIQEFLSVLFSPQLILKFKEGFQWFYC